MMTTNQNKKRTEMEKSLKDILARLAGVNDSEIVDGSTGTDPGVDYAPKPKDEQDFVAKHKTEKHKDRVGNDDVTYKGTTKYSLERDEKHGHKSPKDKQVYDKGMKESAACNMTEEGTACPVHEMAACTSKKPLREIAKKMKKEQSPPATPPITPPGMSVNRSII